MEQILEIRETIIRIFKRYEAPVLIFLKFVLGVFVYGLINGISLYLPLFSGVFKGSIFMPILLMLGASFAVLPASISYGFMIINIVLQLSSCIEAAFIAACVLSLIYVFYIRVDTRHNILILAMLLCYYFKIPYAVPLFAGLYLGAASFIPISIGVFIYSLAPKVLEMAKGYESAGGELFDRVLGVADALAVFLAEIKGNSDWIATAFVLTMVFFVVYISSKISFDYSKDISLALGGVINLIFFLFLSLSTSFSMPVLPMFFFTILSVGLVYCIKFFDIVLDYQRAERVEFEDEENYYYVKIIPKIIINKRSHTLKRIDRSKLNEDRRGGYDNGYDDGYDDYDDGYEEDYDDYDERNSRKRRSLYDDEE